MYGDIKEHENVITFILFSCAEHVVFTRIFIQHLYIYYLYKKTQQTIVIKGIEILIDIFEAGIYMRYFKIIWKF